MKRAVVLLSGGIDSSTSLAIAQSEGFELYALSFDYSQRHKRELDSARLVAESLSVRKHLVIKADLGKIGGSALTSGIEVPKKTKSEVRSQRSEVIPVTYVPARNTIFLSFAVAWAEVIGTGDIFIGANAVDYSGYPDCRPEFLSVFQDMANLATKTSVEGRTKIVIRAPLLSMKKSEIIRKGIELGLDHALTWSCYDPQKKQEAVEKEKQRNVEVLKSPIPMAFPFPGQIYELVPCGACDSCLIRAKGFEEAGVDDPLII